MAMPCTLNRKSTDPAALVFVFSVRVTGPAIQRDNVFLKIFTTRAACRPFAVSLRLFCFTLLAHL
ncbi:hypothetical protein PROAA_610063 [Candidatus Propionivibrio aalborgensis]|uniref:Uncharacterized protein n=1 Tax=Candidatus Propionivibrio aalborgensis TaxID=1860101 RepID=A0A1A8Y2T0_9RHOO|nr:hypothetical protein PROAA_610063 [Candidatus Propionivibrio aalborgensis]